MPRALTAWVAVGLLMLVIAPPCAAGPAPGDHIKPFALERLGAEVMHWQPGKAAVFSFCAFWCDTWKEQSQRLSAAARALNGLPADFITISVDGRWSERGVGKIGGQVLLDPGGEFCQSLGIERIPYTAVVDTEGQVLYATQGIARAAVIEQVVRESLGPEPAASGGTVYLTFDDFPSGTAGPSPSRADDLDDRLLDALRSAGVKATFFCIGNRVKQNEAVLRRAVREGHSVQIHSWDHRTDNPMIERCAQAIKDVTGTNPVLYHPPGSTEFVQVSRDRLPVTVINPSDYLRPGNKELLRRVLLAAKPGNVVLLHAGVSGTLAVLPEIIRALRGRGFAFEVLSR